MRATVRLLTLLPVALIGAAGGVARAEIVADATPAATGSTGLHQMSTVDGVGAPAIRSRLLTVQPVDQPPRSQ